MKSAQRVVLDTNVVLSALLFSRGRLAPLRLAWQRALLGPIVSKVTIEELVRALTYPKFRLKPEDQRELLADYLPYCATVGMPPRPPKTPPCRDASDVPFLQLAIVGKADCLVTGDNDLLGLGSGFVCPIITADALLRSLENG